MNPLFKSVSLLVTLVFLSGCVTQKKHDESISRYSTAVEMLIDSLDQSRALVLRIEDSLALERGGNNYLLQAQQQLEQRLIQQAQQIDELQGNASNTQSNLSAQIGRLQQQRATAEEQFSSLVAAYDQAQSNFQHLSDSVVMQLQVRLESELNGATIRTRLRPGASSLVIQENSLFRSNSSNRLIGEAAPILEAVSEVMSKEPLLKLQIVGHTDNNNNGTDNWQFAALRATHLAKTLTNDYYLSAGRVTASSNGEYAPFTSNSTEEGRTMNRRVEFVFQNELGNLQRELDQLQQQISDRK